jgi:hypothetical protein
MIRSLFLVAAVSGAALAVPAQAQNTQEEYRPTGTRIISQAEAPDPDYSRKLLKRMSACISRYDAEGVVALLRGGNQPAVDYAATGFRDEDDNSPLKMSDCLHEALNGNQLSVEMRIPAAALRTLLAEEAYLDRHSGPLTLPAGTPQVIAGRAVFGGDTPAQQTARGQFADCLVFNAPVEADRLLRGPVGGDEERANARAMAGAIGACLNEGQQANFNTRAIRDFVADGLWARSEALAAQGSGNSQ